ncbi:hypothetical protein CDAR_195251 [Caerostris darwini]|uniref:Ycf1 n=1 Tax=Caerostris darwini TaxID=1538125 RepID=A0AAV4R6A5_9ARAC|nr:hypothetical protein CDAR_195251 [Caerostris darwini]
MKNSRKKLEESNQQLENSYNENSCTLLGKPSEKHRGKSSFGIGFHPKGNKEVRHESVVANCDKTDEDKWFFPSNRWRDVSRHIYSTRGSFQDC